MGFVACLPTLLFSIAHILICLLPIPFTGALSQHPISNSNDSQKLSRRDALIVSSAALSSGLTFLSSPTIAAADVETIDLAAFNAARSKSSSPTSSSSPINIGGKDTKILHSIIPSIDPSPYLSIRGGRNGSSTIRIPRVGYSLYKTPPEQVPRCISFALRCGVRHFDVGTLYSTNSQVSKPLQQYLNNGLSGLKGYYADEKQELLDILDATSLASDKHAVQTLGYTSKLPTMDGSAGRKQRRDELFISHKLSNDEQSTKTNVNSSTLTTLNDKTSYVEVKRSVKNGISELGVGYLDMVLIHSPLTDKERRLATYQALLDLRNSGFVKSIGVCNYGLGPLKEIQEMVNNVVEDLPAINQLELSPFNMHKGIVEYCDKNGIAVGCSAWSKLSGVNGPAEGWAILADLAKAKGMTKAQLLVRWALQKGYVCVPRSGSASKVERIAIAENSYGGVNPMIDGDGLSSFVLNEDEINMLDSLDIGYKAGKLGRRDGWDDDDVTGETWDPTEFV